MGDWFGRAGRSVALLLVLAGCGPRAAAPGSGGAGAAVAAEQVETGAFVGTVGRDTVMIEEFRRSAARLEGRQLVRTPRVQIREYEAELAADGTISRFGISYRAPGSEAAESRATVEFGGGQAATTVTRGDSTQTFEVATGGEVLPFIPYSIALYELPLLRLRGSQADSLPFELLSMGARQPGRGGAARLGEDSVLLRNTAGENRLRVGPDGRLLAWDGRGSTLKLFAERAAFVDFDGLAAAFAAREAAGSGLGTLSPRDTTRATIGGAELAVEYSRPRRRGRTLFPDVVPWGEVWRTGANQATHFSTSRDLEVGGVAVPAGSYTLWTIPGPDEWQLVINQQTGQWGTAYDPARDLARIPMRSSRAAQPVDQFTISITRDGDTAGTLAMEWGDRRVTVPVHVR